jgi:hypothetical protein
MCFFLVLNISSGRSFSYRNNWRWLIYCTQKIVLFRVFISAKLCTVDNNSYKKRTKFCTGWCTRHFFTNTVQIVCFIFSFFRIWAWTWWLFWTRCEFNRWWCWGKEQELTLAPGKSWGREQELTLALDKSWGREQELTLAPGKDGGGGG